LRHYFESFGCTPGSGIAGLLVVPCLIFGGMAMLFSIAWQLENSLQYTRVLYCVFFHILANAAFYVTQYIKYYFNM
jgi:hypothetical protein